MTADHTPERLSAEERETLEQRVREWMRSTSESYIQPVGSDAWVRGLVGYLASGPNSVDRILAAHLADVEARLAAVEVLLTQWRHDLLTNPPTSMRDLGWVQGVEEALGQIEAALHPDPSECPHGDPLCPCPDGLMCHYEGPEAWPVFAGDSGGEREQIARAIYAGGDEPEWLTTIDGSPNAASYEHADRVLAALRAEREEVVAALGRVEARLAEIEALADEWLGWADGRSTPRIDAFRDAAEALKVALHPTPDDPA